MKGFIKYFFSSMMGAIFGTFAGIALLILAVVGIGFAGSRSMQSTSADKMPSTVQKGSVIVLELQNEISEISQETIFGTYLNLNIHDFRETLSKAAEDNKVQGILIKMGNYVPVGWSTAKEMRKVLSDFAESKKKIVAYGDVMDEKALYIASVADKIYMHPTGEVSWNGFAATPVFFKGLFDKIKVEPVIFRAGKYKSAIEPFTNESMSQESRQQTTELLEDLWDETVETIATSRNLDSKELREFSETVMIKTAEQAVKVDLIDGVSRYSDILEMFLKTDKQEGEIKKEDFKKFITPQAYAALKQKGSFLSSIKNNSVFTSNLENKRKIAVLVLEGQIMPGSSEEGIIGSSSVVRELQDLRYDENVKGVVIRINSPGGSALASDVIWYEVEKLKTVKPVFVSMGDVAASGGYYIAAGAEKIYAEANTITGSIGVFSILFNLKEALQQKVGLTFDRVVTNKYADIASGLRDMTEEERALIQEEVKRIYGNFLKVVGKGRRYSEVSNVEAIAQGRVWSGLQAKEVGLVDELGGLEECISGLVTQLKLDDYEIEYFPKSKGIEGFFENLAGIGVQLNSVNTIKKDPVRVLEHLYERFSKEDVLMLLPYRLKIN